MNDLNDLCKSLLEKGDDILAIGVVDLLTGDLLGHHHIVPYFDNPYLDAVAAAVVMTFRGREVRRIESLVSHFRKTKLENSMEEVFLGTQKVFHFMKALPGKNIALVLVTKKTVNQGIGWLSLRTASQAVERALS